MEHIKARGWDYVNSVGINRFPIDALSLNDRNLGFKIISYNDAKEYIELKKLGEYAKKYDGFATKDDSSTFVFYSDELPYAERNKVIMHEVAHIVLGHTTYNNILGHSPDKAIESSQEKEATLFAISFLAPAPKLLDMGIKDAVEISRTTGLSMMDSAFIASEIRREAEMRQFSDKKEAVPAVIEYPTGNRKLIKIIIVALCLVLLFVGFRTMQRNKVAQTPPTVPATTEENISETYYVTKSGDRYHKEDCHYVEGKGIPITLDDAIREGYTPCKVCDPEA